MRTLISYSIQKADFRICIWNDPKGQGQATGVPRQAHTLYGFLQGELVRTPSLPGGLLWSWYLSHLWELRE